VRKQKLFFWVKLISLLLMVSYIFLDIKIAIAQEREELLEYKPVDINVARQVAADYLPTYYPGQWAYFHNIVFYDLDAQPAAYAFIFRKETSGITALQDLEDTMLEALSERDKITEQILQIKQSEDLHNDEKRNKIRLLKTQLKDQNKVLYKWDTFATLITGATNRSSLVIDHYRGLPPIFVNKNDLQNSLKSNYPDKNLELGRILFLSPFDIRYEAAVTGTTQQLIAESSYVLDVRTKTIEKISVLKDRIQKSGARKARKRDLMTPEARELYDKGIRERERERILKWQKRR